MSTFVFSGSEIATHNQFSLILAFFLSCICLTENNQLKCLKQLPAISMTNNNREVGAFSLCCMFHLGQIQHKLLPSVATQRPPEISQFQWGHLFLDITTQ